MWVDVHVEARGLCWKSLLVVLHLIFLTETSAEPRAFNDRGTLAEQQAPRILPSARITAVLRHAYSSAVLESNSGVCAR